jgi:coatomer subunit gamma
LSIENLPSPIPLLRLFEDILTYVFHGSTDATEQLSQTLSLQPLEGTDVVLSNSTHTLKLYGKSVGGGRVAGLIKMAFSAKSGVTIKVSIRAEEEGLAAAVVGSVA